MASALTATLPGEGEEVSGIFETSSGLLRRRLVALWGEGLAQYIALRIGDGPRGRAAYGSFLRTLGALPPEELLEPPGPKARLYRLARSIAQTECAIAGSRRPGVLRRRAIEGTRGAAIERLRAELSEEDAELLELRHARELSVAEIACVLDRADDEIELALDTAEARARRIASDEAPDPLASRATLYVDVFALEPGWDGDDEVIDLSAIDDTPLEPGTIVGGRYAIVERVGTGAFGEVYRAEDTEVPGHRVALKLLRHPSLGEPARRAALRELRLNAAVFHPSLVQFKDHGWFEQRLWFVMPWYEGETLETRIRRAPLDRAEARRIFEPLARALAALHAVGIRHQDIKPDNIFLARLPGQDEVLPVLLDFGVAADAQEGLLAGTPLYFAPEVAARFAAGSAEPGAEVGAAADVFALALSLRNALEPETREEVPPGEVSAFIERRARQAPALPQSRNLRFLRSAFERWLSTDPRERPTADAFAEELAILTLPEERRARRARVLRWLLPSLIALAGIFGAVVHHLDGIAAQRELEAARARDAAALARADLALSDARRRAIEEGHAALLARYEQSRMSRRELADRLATTEGTLRATRAELERATEMRDAARAELARTRASLEAERDAARAELARTRASLEAERDAARAEARALAHDLEETRAELAAERARTRDLTAELATERRARSSAEERATSLANELAVERRAKEEAEAELARVRAHVDRLVAAVRATPRASRTTDERAMPGEPSAEEAEGAGEIATTD